MSSGDVLPADVLSAALAALPKKKKAVKGGIAKAGKTKKHKKRSAAPAQHPGLPTASVLPADPLAPAPVAKPIVKFINEHRFGQRLLRDTSRPLRQRKLRRPPASR